MVERWEEIYHGFVPKDLHQPAYSPLELACKRIAELEAIVSGKTMHDAAAEERRAIVEMIQRRGEEAP